MLIVKKIKIIVIIYNYYHYNEIMHFYSTSLIHKGIKSMAPQIHPQKFRSIPEQNRIWRKCQMRNYLNWTAHWNALVLTYWSSFLTH